jgi:hypothetical protein
MVAQDPFDRPSPARCAAVATGASAALSGLLCWLLPLLDGPAAELDGALTRGSAGAALLAAAWLWLGTLRLVLAAHGGRGEHVHLTGGLPAPVRRLVLVACGVALSGSLAVSAQSGAAVPHRDGGGLPAPDRAATADQVVVLPGDSLWSIAADSLPAGARDARVAQRWPRIYALNRTVIGPDPDLIQPAQRLVLPSR